MAMGKRKHKLDHKLTNGERVRIYYKPSFADKWTAVYLDRYFEHTRTLECMGMSDNPFHPQGVGMHGECQVGPHLGRIVKFETMPDKCQKCVEIS